MSTWKPIETAPKDKILLLFQPAHKSGQMTLSARIIIEYPDHLWRECTHWMPLPPPPSSAAKGEGEAT